MFFLPTKKNGSVKNCWLKGSLGNPKSFFDGNVVKNHLLETFGELLGKQEGRDGLGETKPIQIPATPLGMMGSRRRMWHHKQAIIKSDSLEEICTYHYLVSAEYLLPTEYYIHQQCDPKPHGKTFVGWSFCSGIKQ